MTGARGSPTIMAPLEQLILNLEPGNFAEVTGISHHEGQFVDEGDRDDLEVGFETGESAPLEAGFDPAEHPGALPVEGKYGEWRLGSNGV
jgi:hypothetical protein